MILFVLAGQMVVGQGQSGGQLIEGKDAMRLAQVPLAVPYLLNPVGIVGLVTISAEARSLPVLAVAIAVLVVVLLLDLLVFGWASRAGQTVNEDRLLIIEKVFGFLLAALAVELVLDGLSSFGIIPAINH